MKIFDVNNRKLYARTVRFICARFLEFKKWIIQIYKNNVIYLRPVEKNKIVFDCFNGSGYGCNLKYIANEIIRQNLPYKMVWLVENMNEDMPECIKKVKYGTFEAKKEYATAKLWIRNCKSNMGVRKRKGQYYLQTWHGGVGIKAIEADVENMLPESYVRESKIDSKMTDYVLSNSDWFTALVKRAFWYDGEILKTGLPREDILFNGDDTIADKVKGYYGIENKKIVLFAPTFRNEEIEDHYILNYDELIDALKKKYGGEFVVLRRLHPNLLHSDISTIINDEMVIDATNYPDVQELLLAADILITDYSSLMMEMMYLKKPVFLLVRDYKEYLANERSAYFELGSMPFPICETQEELYEKIINFNETEYDVNRATFIKQLGFYETGNAVKNVVKHIVSIM